MIKDRSLRFILRRSIWWEKVTRYDLMEAFKMPEASASRTLAEACEKWPSTLVRKKRHVEAAPHCPIPPEASSETMLHLLEAMPDSFADTGLRVPDELRIAGTLIRKPLPIPAELTDLLLQATIQSKMIDIRYVGLKYGDKARWRSVLPLSLDSFQGQWRIHAHDLEVVEFTVKTFVAHRILEARASLGNLPKNLKMGLGELNYRRFKISLNPRLTKDQKMAVARELGLDDKGVIQLNETEVFYFRRTYVDIELKNDEQTVCPLVVAMKLL